MQLTIKSKLKSKCSKYEFSIYEHSLSLSDLDNYILDILYDESKLNYLFDPNQQLINNNRIKQLQRFIGNPFRNCEEDISDVRIWDEIDTHKNDKSYYTFFAEALLARLNIDLLDDKLITGVISIGENVSVVGHGADVCMYSDNMLVIGEAKFYSKLYSGTSSIIKDKSFISKLEDYIARLNGSDSIILKDIDGDISSKTEKEIKKLPFTLSGFILHSQELPISKYDTSYKLIDSIDVKNLPSHYCVHLYHLPIESKNELIFKAQRKAIDLIINTRES